MESLTCQQRRARLPVGFWDMIISLSLDPLLKQLLSRLFQMPIKVKTVRNSLVPCLENKEVMR